MVHPTLGVAFGLSSSSVNLKTITRERRKLKKYRHLVDRGDLKLVDVENAFKTWLGTYDKLLSYRSKKNMMTLYKELFERMNK